MSKDSLSELGEKIGEVDNPKVMLEEIFKFMNFEPANRALYFLLLEKQEPQTVRQICRSLTYSERTVREYLKDLLKMGFITRKTTINERPCYAYTAVKPSEVWRILVEKVRAIRKMAGARLETY